MEEEKQENGGKNGFDDILDNIKKEIQPETEAEPEGEPEAEPEGEPEPKHKRRGRKSKEQKKVEFFEQNLPIVGFITDFIFNKYLGSRAPKWRLNDDEKRLLDESYTSLLYKYQGSIFTKWSVEIQAIVSTAIVVIPRLLAKKDEI